MSSPQEREELDKKIDFIIKEAAGENPAASEYLYMLSTCSRIVDDIFDQDIEVTRQNLLTLTEVLFVRIPSNTFYREHQDFLFSQHVVMWNAWDISNVLIDGNQTDKIYAHVLRDYIHEILPLVALLTQGHNKMKDISSLVRTLFHKELGD
jgi:hypothetical protein